MPYPTLGKREPNRVEVLANPRSLMPTVMPTQCPGWVGVPDFGSQGINPGGYDVGVIELVEASAAAALEHASELQGHLHTASDGDSIRECRAELHRLVGDIVSLRNAAELLRREVQPNG
jgi:hypothetical protein